MISPPRARAISTLLLLTIVIAVLAVSSMWEDSATPDEAAHIAAGLLKVTDGRVDLYATQAPLIEALMAMPVFLTGHRVPDAWHQYENRPWVIGRMLLFQSGYDGQRILRLARMPVILFFLALCFVVFWFVRDVTSSDAAAIAAFALTGFCPTLLAHGRLATVDMGVTLFGFAAFALFVKLLRSPSKVIAIATGIAVACTLASKVSGVLLVPVLAIVFVLWLREGVERAARVGSVALAALVSILAFMAIYLLLARSFDLSLPFRAFLSEALAVRTFYQSSPLPQFLLGEFSGQGWPHYYLVAIAVKTPLPVLALLLLAVVPLVRSRRLEVIGCLVFALLFMLVAAFSSLNLGIRHVLPIYPFVFAGCAIALFDASRRMRIAAAVLITAEALVALLVWPSYLSYFNPLIGNPRNADRILIDSNLDWGQDLRRLARWTRENRIDVIHVHYFGAADLAATFGPHAIRWPAPRPQLLPRGWFAVSRHFYRLSFLRSRSPVDYDTYLRDSHARYVTTIGGSIDVYRVD